MKWKMNNSHDEIKQLLKASREMLTNSTISEDYKQIRSKYGIITEQGVDLTDNNITKKTNITKSVEETMEEFVTDVSDLVDFNSLNVYPQNVEWSGRLIEFDIEFFFSIGEENGIYINGEMIKTDEKFLEMVEKLKLYYEKFKSKWSKILSSRKKTKDFE
jgi:hypothetical protein